MCVLSDIMIAHSVSRGSISIEPYDVRMVQPSSYDVALGNSFRIFKETDGSILDPRDENFAPTEEVIISNDEPFTLMPGQFALATTKEYIGLSNSIVARLEGKSSLGRLGLMVHSTAGYIDPGFAGNITLELYNLSSNAINLYAGMPIGQLSFTKILGEVGNPYGSESLNSKYFGQTGATASRYSDNFNGVE